MKNIQKIFIIAGVFSFFLMVKVSYATFSMVAVDPETKEVGTVIATCLNGYDLSTYAAKLVPGKGAINSQSYFNKTNVKNALELMKNNNTASEIINWLELNDAQSRPNIRQNLAVTIDLNGTIDSAGFTGAGSGDYKNHIVGDGYVIAGNILSGAEILNDMEAAFVDAEGELSFKLMAALQAAKQIGADKRCVHGSAAAAYMAVAKADESLLNTPSLHLVVKGYDSGVDPIDTLQQKYNAWQAYPGDEPVNFNSLRKYLAGSAEINDPDVDKGDWAKLYALDQVSQSGDAMWGGAKHEGSSVKCSAITNSCTILKSGNYHASSTSVSLWGVKGCQLDFYVNGSIRSYNDNERGIYAGGYNESKYNTATAVGIIPLIKGDELTFSTLADRNNCGAFSKFTILRVK